MDPVDSDDELMEDGQLLTKRSAIIAETSLQAGIVPENIPQTDPTAPALNGFKLVT